MTSFSTSWLSEGAETLVREIEQSDAQDFHCELLIVGSGYGGAVAAARLAGSVDEKTRKPIKVWLLERGREHLVGMFPSRFAELAGHVRFSTQDGKPARGYAEALIDLRLGSDVGVVVGNGLGGGSLINAGVMEQADDDVLSGWPASLDRRRLAAGYDAAKAMLGARPIPLDVHYGKYCALDNAAQENKTQARRCAVAVSLDGAPTPAGVAMAPCTHRGDCVTGCNQGAKLTLDTNYLALARRRRARLFCGAVVERIAPRQRGPGGWDVHWHYTAASRRPADEQATTIRARRVVLAAGALGSTEILLRSRSKVLVLSGELGKHFSTNGDQLLAGFRRGQKAHACGDESLPSQGVGPTITGLVHAESQGRRIAVEEFGVPSPLRLVFGEVIASFGALEGHLPFEVSANQAEDPAAVTGALLEDTALFGFMGDDEAAGVLGLAPAPAGPFSDGQVRIDWAGVHKADVFEAQRQWLEQAYPKDERSGQESFTVTYPLHGGPVVTVHPLGGCRIGDTAADGVVDAAGCVFDGNGKVHPGLAVLDGSIVPGALGINPALTIAALAEQAVPTLKSRWGLADGDGALEPLRRRPWRARSGRQARRGTAVGIQERLLGRFEIAGQPLAWAVLRVEFDEISDLAAALVARPWRVGARARLELFEIGPDEAAMPPDELGPALGWADMRGEIELFATEPGSLDRRLIYRFGVVEAGGALAGRKTFDGTKHLSADTNVSPWRQLSEMQVKLDGQRNKTAWALDLADLARQGNPLLRVLRQANQPDALAALAGLGLYVLRLLVGRTFGMPAIPGDLPHRLDERLPKTVAGYSPAVHRLADQHGARLSHYAPMSADQKRHPVLLIHGLGASGSTFAHASIRGNLVATLLDERLHVWVLDLRTSIGNEPADPADPRGGLPGKAPWSIDDVAQGDIPAALALVRKASNKPVDVVAHCIGAAMFCTAALSGAAVRAQIGTVVLSQVGPLVELSPMNRFRGFVASYLEHFLQIGELDTRPEWHRVRRNGQVGWEHRPRSGVWVLLDALLATFPYPDGDHEASRVKALWRRHGTGTIDFRIIRHRADAIFGQLMELENVGDDTLLALDAIYGWVNLRTLAQVIHYARHGMIVGASGRNEWLSRKNVEARFDFPLLLLHGQRNRVFDWRGSLRSMALLERIAGRGLAPPKQTQDTCRWGDDGPRQMVLLKRYGHQDCLIGKHAQSDVFEHIVKFLEAQSGKQVPAPPADPAWPVSAHTPWVGPALGWIQKAANGNVTVRLLVHPTPRQPSCYGLALIPVAASAAAPPSTQAARIVDWADGAPVELTVVRSALPGEAFVVATLHADLPLSGDFETFGWQGLDWLRGSRAAQPAEHAALESYLAGEAGRDSAPRAILRLAADVLDAADDAGTPQAPLVFALGSCLYPAGLFDRDVAMASYEQLDQGLERDPEGVRPQFLLLTGDQIYLDETAGVFDPGPASAPAAVERAYELNWRLPAVRRVRARLPTYTMLDDHEVRDDWQPGRERGRDPETKAAIEGFERYQGALNPAGRAGGRDYVFNAGGAGFFVLDTRSRRAPRRVGSHGDGVTLQEAGIVARPTMADLCAWLIAQPRDAVKFVVSPSPVLPLEDFPPGRDDERLRADGWSGYPASLCELLAFIERKTIERVVFLSGDAHLSLACKLVLDGSGVTVYSIVSSGLHAPWPFANARRQEFVLAGPVTLACGARTLSGMMSTPDVMLHNGHARVSLAKLGGDPHGLLRVAFVGVGGSSSAWQHPLGQPGGTWAAWS